MLTNRDPLDFYLPKFPRRRLNPILEVLMREEDLDWGLFTCGIGSRDSFSKYLKQLRWARLVQPNSTSLTELGIEYLYSNHDAAIFIRGIRGRAVYEKFSRYLKGEVDVDESTTLHAEVAEVVEELVSGSRTQVTSRAASLFQFLQELISAQKGGLEGEGPSELMMTTSFSNLEDLPTVNGVVIFDPACQRLFSQKDPHKKHINSMSYNLNLTLDL